MLAVHDIGKPKTQEFVGDRIKFIGHEQVGAEMAEAVMRRLKFPAQVVKKVSRLVAMHMRPHKFSDEYSEKQLRKFIRKVGEDLDDLLDLSEADALGKLPQSIYHDKLRQDIKRIKEAPVAPTNKPVLDGKEIMRILNLKKGGPVIKEVMEFLKDLMDDYASKGKALSKQEAEEAVKERFVS